MKNMCTVVIGWTSKIESQRKEGKIIALMCIHQMQRTNNRHHTPFPSLWLFLILLPKYVFFVWAHTQFYDSVSPWYVKYVTSYVPLQSQSSMLMAKCYMVLSYIQIYWNFSFHHRQNYSYSKINGLCSSPLDIEYWVIPNKHTHLCSRVRKPKVNIHFLSIELISYQKHTTYRFQLERNAKRLGKFDDGEKRCCKFSGDWFVLLLFLILFLLCSATPSSDDVRSFK